MYMAMFSFVRLWFELRASHLQSRCSTSRATPPVHFVLVIIGDRWGLTNYLPRLTSIHDPPNVSLTNS
jgi:hypothetical protein